jgi:DNA processing protein
MAVPGPVTSDLSAGCHSVIRDWDGILVTSADDVIETLSGAAVSAGARGPGAISREAASGSGRAELARDSLDLEAATVLDALPVRGGMTTSDIAVRAGLDDKTVRARLAVLAVLGLAERTERGWHVRRPPCRPRGIATIR